MSEPGKSNDETMAYQPAAPSRPSTMAGTDSPLSIPSLPATTDDAAVTGYEILNELGRGGMGVVYKARQIALNRTVALKMILSGRHTGETQLARFRAEAEALAKIQHPNIVQVYDVGTHQGHPYIALEFVEGGNLAEKTRSIPQPPRAAARLMQILADAIQAAHDAGIVHRDLKPVNILLHHFTLGDAGPASPSASHHKSSSKSSWGSKSGVKQSILTHVSVEYGTPKITDFGLAKQEEGAASGLTHAGSIMGTPSYMSPEQAIGDVGLIGPATDVYALGAILYELLTGRPPFRADTPVNTIMQVIRGEVVAPSKLVAKLPIDLETITLKCLEKAPQRRYPSAAALATDLGNYLEDRPISARPAGRIERVTKWMKRYPVITGFIAAIVCGVISFIVLGIWAYLAVTERARVAESAQQQAAAAATESNLRLIRLAVANGTQLLDKGDMLGGAAWFAEALKLDEGNQQHQSMHRKRIAAVLERCPILGQLWEHEAAINTLALSPDGKLIVSGGNDGLIRLWNLETGKPACTPIENGSEIATIEFSPDGNELVVLSVNGACKLLDWQSSQFRLLGQGIAMVHFTPDGSQLITAGKAGGLVVYRRTNLEPLTGMMANNGTVTDFSLTSDGTGVLAPSHDGNVRFWDTSKGTLKIPLLKQGSEATAVAIHPEGKLGASGGKDGRVWLWNLATGELSLPVPWKHDDTITQIQFSPDGRWLATASEDKQCIVWEVETGKQYSPRLKHGSRVDKIRFSPDGLWIATLSEDNFARIWDVRTGRPVVSPFRHNGTPQALLFNASGRGFLTAGRDRLLRHWILPLPVDEETDPVIAQTAAEQAISLQSRMILSADGKLAANCGSDQAVRVRDAKTREPRGAVIQTTGVTSMVAFSHDSQLLATGGIDGQVQLWSVISGQARWPQAARHTSRVYTIAFHPQGTLVATGSDDNTVRLWNAETGQSLFAPIRHDGTVYWLSFSADGNTLCSASIDGSTRVWDASTGEAVTPKLPAWNGKPWKEQLHETSSSIKELLALTQAVNGMEVDKQGGMTLLAPWTIRERFEQVREKTEQTFIPNDHADWHEFQARSAEKQEQWFAAAWQLEQLTRLTPKSDVLRRRLGLAWSKMGAWNKVVDASTQSLILNPASIDGWLQRGRAYGELKKWRESIRDIAQGVLLQQQQSWRIVMPALMKLELGDVTGYQKDCNALLLNDQLDNATRLALVQISILRPLPLSMVHKLQTWLEPISKSTPDSIEVNLFHAALLLRAGQKEEALQALKALKTDTVINAQRWLWQALAEKQLNQTAASEASLKTAQQLMRVDTGTLSSRSWQEEVIIKTLIEEIQGLNR